MSNVGIIGSGPVGLALANGFLKHGYQVKIGTSDPGKLSEWKSKAGANASVGSSKDAASFGEIVVLAVKGDAALSAIERATPSALTGKTVSPGLFDIINILGKEEVLKRLNLALDFIYKRQ